MKIYKVIKAKNIFGSATKWILFCNDVEVAEFNTKSEAQLAIPR